MQDLPPRASGTTSATPLRDHASSRPRRTVKRRDIQALRAVAVAGVVVNHLNPDWLTGGHLGVDVFFVVSGYLITSHLFRDATNGTLSLPHFWARRVRRLMPASLITLAATALAVLLWVPQHLWRAFLNEILASSWYVQNWQLIITDSDYFTEGDPASPALHFWSLAVEEQFYLLWPVLIVVSFALLRRRGRRRDASATAGALLVIGAISYVAAHLSTQSAPVFSFYATSSRVWEFALGGIIALVPSVFRERHVEPPRLPDWPGVGLTWAAWTALLASMVALGPTSFHPGPATLWPTLATAAIIAMNRTDSTWLLGRSSSLRPVQWLGDVSYSLYLWHWPVIVISAYVHPEQSAALTLVQLMVSIILSALSYALVEQPTRHPRADGWFVPPRVFLYLVAGMAMVALAAAPGLLQLQSQVNATNSQISRSDTTDPCLGANSAVASHQCSEQARDLFPAPAVAGEYFSDLMVEGGCYAARDTTDYGVCHVGELGGDAPRVLLVGDSHARDLAPAMVVIAHERGWDLAMTARSACAYVLAEYGSKRRSDSENATCFAWRDQVTQLIRDGDFDIVVTVGQQGVTWAGADRAERDAEGVAGALRAFDIILDSGAQVVTLQDTPLPREDVFACVERWATEAATRCGQPVEDAYRNDTLAEAAERATSDKVHLIPTRHIYCDQEYCSPVVGGVFVYADANGHINRVWSASLGEALSPSLADVLSVRPPSRA